MDAARAVLWLTGSLDGRGWAQAVAAARPAGAADAGGGRRRARALRLIELGDDTATAPRRAGVACVRQLLLAAAVLLAAGAAAAAGPVSFVALVAPHLARRLTRAPGPNLAAVAGTGAVLLVAADLAAQRAFDGHQLPVGVVTGRDRRGLPGVAAGMTPGGDGRGPDLEEDAVHPGESRLGGVGLTLAYDRRVVARDLRWPCPTGRSR